MNLYPVGYYSMLDPLEALKVHEENRRKQQQELDLHNEEVAIQLAKNAADHMKKKDPNWVSKFINDKETIYLTHEVLVKKCTFPEAKQNLANELHKQSRWVTKATGSSKKLASLLDNQLYKFSPEVQELITTTDELGTLNLTKLSKGLSTGFKTLNQQIELGTQNMNTAQEVLKLRMELAKVKYDLNELQEVQTKTVERVTLVEQCAIVMDNSVDWKQAAIELRTKGVKVVDIVKAVGRGKTQVSTYLNQPEVKAIWNK